MSGSNEGECDLTPMLDMVFQLITFFMLVINFKGASLDLSLKLPVLGSARPMDHQGKQEPVLLNVDAEGHVKAYGQVVDIEQHMEREARLLKVFLRLNGQEDKGDLPVTVIIRADRSAPFRLVNHVITTCQNHGYRQFSLSAMTREEGR